MLSPFSRLSTVPYQCQNLLACFQLYSDMRRSITRCYSIYRNENSNYTAVALVQQCTFFKFLALNCIVFEFNVPRTKSNIKSSYRHISQGLQN